MKPKAAIVCRLVNGFGGTTTTVLEHARRLVEAGWSVDVVAARADGGAVRATGARLVRLPHWPWGGHVKRRIFAELAAYATGARYDVIHGHGDERLHDILSLHNCVHATHEAVHGAPLPETDPTGRLHSRILRARGFRFLVANSKLMARDVEARFGVEASRVRVIYPGLREGKFKVEDRARLRPQARASLGFGAQDVVVGLITSGDFAKRGVARFIAALAKAEPRARVRGLVMGKESRLNPYAREARKAGVADRLRFHEPAADVERWFHALDVYCHPAAFEEFGQSVLEGLACGLPVVAGAKVGAAELFPDALRPFVLATTDADELAGKLSALAADAGLRERLGREAAAAAAGRGWAANFAQTLELYRAVLDEKKPAANR